jgi:hypothetical protein
LKRVGEVKRTEIIFAAVVIFFFAGCENGQEGAAVVDEMEVLRAANVQLSDELAQSQEQIQVLSGLGPEVRLENVYDLQGVKLTRFTNLYDKDGDGTKEKLIVYLKPEDKEGDAVKASGTVDVELWDLARGEGEALVGKWHVDAQHLRQQWFATMVAINYRLLFDVGDLVEGDEKLVVKVVFTDYLSGKVFREQMVIKPR